MSTSASSAPPSNVCRRWVDTITAAQFEVDLVRVAVGVGPKELRETADLRLFLLDQDGPEPDDAERARKRHFTTTAQGRDAMTAASANFTPQAWAVWEVIFAKYAAPGMCNPADEQPCTSGTPSPGADRHRRPHPGPTPARRDAGGRAHRVDER